MKFLILLLAFASFAQAPFVTPTIDTEVEAAFLELAQIANDHQKDYTTALQNAGLLSIQVVDELPEGDLGLYERNGSTFTVKIARITLKDPNVLKWTLAHELGHGLKLKHSDEALPDGTYPWSIEIMSGNGILTKTHLIYQLRMHSGYNQDLWKNYFNQIK